MTRIPRARSLVLLAALGALQARYDLRRVCLPAWLELMGDTAGQPAPDLAEEFAHV